MKELIWWYRKTYRDWQNYVYIRHMNVLINDNYSPERTVHIDNQQCYTLIQSKRKKKRKVIFQLVEYSVFVLRLFYNYLHSFNMCVRRTNVTVTNIQARTTLFFSIFFSRSLPSWVLFRLRRRMTMQHRAISIGRAYSTLTLFFFFFFFYDSLLL